jgi:hypothetical protein
VKKKAGREGPTFWDCLKFKRILSRNNGEGKRKTPGSLENKGFLEE